jgi:hypothetical protein
MGLYDEAMSKTSASQCSRQRLVEWCLLSVAVLFAAAFAASVAYVGYLFLHSWAGIPGRYVLLMAIPLAVSLAACLSLARVEQGHRSTSS